MNLLSDPFAKKTLEILRRFTTNYARRRWPELAPRRWSNVELKKLCAPLKGDVVNVSGFKDEDKEGGLYRNYFPEADSYTITNYAGSGVIGDGAPGSIYLDLQSPPEEDMKARFDVVFNHTVLEHIEDVHTAFGNLAHMTRDVLITVVPFLQDEHYAPGIYGDFWRYTPMGLKSLYETNGLRMIYLNANDSPWYPVYLIAVGVRHPDRHLNHPPSPHGPESRTGHDIYVYPKCVW